MIVVNMHNPDSFFVLLRCELFMNSRDFFLFRLTCLSFVFLWLLSLGGCSGPAPQMRNLIKSDIDMVADAHLQQAETLLEELACKLYRRNPRELKKGQGTTVEERMAQLFTAGGDLFFTELDGKKGVSALLFALDVDYQGDRVFPLLVGLLSMIRSSYNDHTEFFLLDSLDPQKLYNSARNIEVLVWRLKSRLAADGSPLLLTNSLESEERNLSFERLFGKLIANQDMIAQIAAEKWNRIINRVVHSAATAVFLPVGF